MAHRCSGELKGVETRSAGPPHPSEGEKPGADGPGPVRAGVDPTLNQVMFQFKKEGLPETTFGREEGDGKSRQSGALPDLSG